METLLLFTFFFAKVICLEALKSVSRKLLSVTPSSKIFCVSVEGLQFLSPPPQRGCPKAHKQETAGFKDMACSGQTYCRLYHMANEVVPPAWTGLHHRSGDQLASPRANKTSLMNQHLGISKGWPSWLLLCLEKSRSEWKKGKARQCMWWVWEGFSLLPCKNELQLLRL